MTSSLAAAANGREQSLLPPRHAAPQVQDQPPTRALPPRRVGFTLIELLVVIGIIVVLLGILLPMLTRAYANARRARMQSDLTVIASALDAYRADFKDYPRTDPIDVDWGGSKYTNHLRGACTLCWALMAPGNATGSTTGFDGNNGYGFRIRTSSGQVYGPYMNPDQIKVVLMNGTTAGDNHNYFLADTDGYPYLYFPANKGATLVNPSTGVAEVNNANGYLGSTSSMNSVTTGIYPLFDTDDNDIADEIPSSGTVFSIPLFGRSPSDSYALQRFQVMLGASTTGSATGTMADGAAAAPKATGLSYLLYGLGPDNKGGPDTPTNSQSVSTCDDVYNFQ